MAKIQAKKAFSGFVLGVEFVDGHAETEIAPAIAFFEQSPDYTVGEPKAAKPAAAADGK
jgi:hypothetical protein